MMAASSTPLEALATANALDSASEEYKRKFFGPLLPGQTVEDRFGEIKGSQRWRLIKQIYGLKPPDGGSQWAVLFFTEDGKLHRALFRSKNNARKQDTVVKRFCKGILESGVVMLCRGDPIAIATDHPERFELLAAATLVESFFLAYNIDPSNVYVQEALRDGLLNCFVVSSMTPDDVQFWTKRNHDQYHIGSSMTFIEKFEEIVGAEAG